MHRTRSIFGDEEDDLNCGDDGFDSEDERQTENLENYILRHLEAPPPLPPNVTVDKSAIVDRKDFGETKPDERTIR